jgi:hypothetical protein
MLKQNLMVIAILWERHTLWVVDTFIGVRILWVANMFLVVENSLLANHSRWH